MSEIIDERWLQTFTRKACFEPAQLEPSDIRTLLHAVECALRKEREWKREEGDLLLWRKTGCALFVTKDGLKSIQSAPDYREPDRAPKIYRRLIARAPTMPRFPFEDVPTVALEGCEVRNYELQGFATVEGRRVLKYVEV